MRYLINNSVCTLGIFYMIRCKSLLRHCLLFSLSKMYLNLCQGIVTDSQSLINDTACDHAISLERSITRTPLKTNGMGASCDCYEAWVSSAVRPPAALHFLEGATGIAHATESDDTEEEASSQTNSPRLLNGLTRTATFTLLLDILAAVAGPLLDRDETYTQYALWEK